MSFNKKEKLEWLKLTHLIMKDKKLSKKQLDRFEWLKIKGYYYDQNYRKRFLIKSLFLLLNEYTSYTIKNEHFSKQ